MHLDVKIFPASCNMTRLINTLGPWNNKTLLNTLPGAIIESGSCGGLGG